MSVAAPPPAPSTNPLRVVAEDLRAERRLAGLPPGDLRPSLRRTHRMVVDPLSVLLPAYERFGPVFSLRVLHQPNVMVLGPEANHTVLVAKARSFGWRDGSLRDLIPLLGDGLLTIDGEFHRLTRKAMVPGFHRERIAAAAGTMVEETDRELARWRPGETVDVYARTRDLALRIAMRALFGLDPDRDAHGVDAAAEFERALGFYGREYLLQALRGPLTPWWQMQRARERLDRVVLGEVERRRRHGVRGEDLLSMLLDVRDEDGRALSDRTVRDQVMTMLFAGHDTTTATVSFLLHLLARHPDERDRVLREQDDVLGGRVPAAADLMGGLPVLSRVIDETLRLYPPAWIGPRRALEDVEVCGVPIPAGAFVNYSSYASHRLPDVFPDPEAFVPDRWLPERAAALPKGAYVPFGAGSRICIGMRFGQLEVTAILTRILQRFLPEALPGRRLEIRETPTLGPKGGLPMRLRPRPA